jgi:septal ring factor EnvC (AmiA/AmiB activator)
MSDKTDEPSGARVSENEAHRIAKRLIEMSAAPNHHTDDKYTWRRAATTIAEFVKAFRDERTKREELEREIERLKTEIKVRTTRELQLLDRMAEKRQD